MFLLFPCFTRYFRGGRFLYASNAYVGLALPGDEGSWQIESKVYLELEPMKLIFTGNTFGLNSIFPQSIPKPR